MLRSAKRSNTNHPTRKAALNVPRGYIKRRSVYATLGESANQAYEQDVLYVCSLLTTDRNISSATVSTLSAPTAPYRNSELSAPSGSPFRTASFQPGTCRHFVVNIKQRSG